MLVDMVRFCRGLTWGYSRGRGKCSPGNGQVWNASCRASEGQHMRSPRRTPLSRLAQRQHVSWHSSLWARLLHARPFRSLQNFFSLGLWKDRRAMGGSRAPAVEHAGRRVPPEQALSTLARSAGSGSSNRGTAPIRGARGVNAPLTHWVPVASSGTCPRSNTAAWPTSNLVRFYRRGYSRGRGKCSPGNGQMWNTSCRALE